MQVRNTISADAKPSVSEQVHRFFDAFVPMDALLVTARGVGVFFLLVGTVFGGGIASAQAYRDAVPGMVTYKVKVAIEAAQLMLAPNDAYRTRLHTEFADRRMDEAAYLAEGDAAAQARVAVTLGAFDREIASLGAGLDALTVSEPQAVVETAKLLERKMAVYQSGLRKTGALVQSGAARAVSASRRTVDGVSIKAMAIIVEHHLAGDAGASKTVVAAKFEDRIKDAEAAVAGATAENSTQAKAALAATKALLEEGNYQAALSKIEEIAVLTEEEPAEEAAPVTEPAAEETAPAPVTEPAPPASDIKE